MEVGVAIGFWSLATVTVLSALAVVLLRNLFHAALFLVLSFLGVAGIYITLSADFVAAVQILLYAGAISVLLIFAIMLTRDPQQGNLSSELRGPALFVSVMMVITIIVIVLNADWPRVTEGPPIQTTTIIADALFNRFVLPFEIASVMLLAAMIGAIALVRER